MMAIMITIMKKQFKSADSWKKIFTNKMNNLFFVFLIISTER